MHHLTVGDGEGWNVTVSTIIIVIIILIVITTVDSSACINAV